MTHSHIQQATTLNIGTEEVTLGNQAVCLLLHVIQTGTAWFSRVFQLFALRSRRTFKSGGIDVCEGSPVDICQVSRWVVPQQHLQNPHVYADAQVSQTSMC